MASSIGIAPLAEVGTRSRSRRSAYAAAISTTPTLLVHGIGSTFTHNWVQPGWVDLLAEEGRVAVPFELPGHGGSPVLGDVPGDDVDRLIDAARSVRVASGLPPDVVGFSAGAALALRSAVREPRAFGRLALMGVGDSLLEDDRAAAESLAGTLTAESEPLDPTVRIFWRLIASAGNDRGRVADYLAHSSGPLTKDGLRGIDQAVLLVLGDRDFAGPADRLVGALPDGRLVVVPGVDHFATTADVRCIDAVLRFLAE